MHDATLDLVSHPATASWRQRHPTVEARIDNLASHPAQSDHSQIVGRKLLDLSLEDLNAYRKQSDHVVSISSLIEGADGCRRHLALMDLCLEEFIPFDRLVTAVRRISEERNAWLLWSGRHYHVYGEFLLTRRQWRQWNYQFQMSLVLADARYVAHSLRGGCNLLRLNAGEHSHGTVPVVTVEDPEPVRGELVNRAKQLAHSRHAGQLRRSGQPMIHHLREVAALAVQIRDECLAQQIPPCGEVSTEELYAIGYLHDCIEDTSADYEDVERVAGRVVADCVSLLSMDKRLGRMERYVLHNRQLKNARRAPRIVKLADLLSNLRGLSDCQDSDWAGRYLTTAADQLELIREGLDRCSAFEEAQNLLGSHRKMLGPKT